MKYTNIQLILDRVKRHPLLKDLTLETAVDYAQEFIRIVGIEPSFIHKVETIHIDNFRGQLPCDFYYMKQVRTKEHPHGPHPHRQPIYFRYTTDSFHLAPSPGGELTYMLQNSCIFVNVPKMDIEISYLAMPTDENGYPLIPDEPLFTRALELYIKYKEFTNLYDQDKIKKEVMFKTETDYYAAVAQAQNSLIVPSEDQMESITNLWGKLLPNTDRNHQSGYKHAGNVEHLLTH